jgi:membrane-associated phospholipid phosphatase
LWLVFCGLLAYFAGQHWKGTKARYLLAVSSVTITAIVGFDRIYLNVHWFSDVLGGCMLDIFWLAFSILAFKYLKKDISNQINLPSVSSVFTMRTS